MQGGASGTGSVTLLAPNTNNTDVLTLPDVAADTLASLAATQTLTNKTLGSGLVAGASYLTSGTAVASTSGTSIDFTSIPSWVKRITVMFQGVSLSGTSSYLIQLGAGSVTTSGYLGYYSYQENGGTPAASTSTAGFQVYENNASNLRYGTARLVNISGNNWICDGVFLGTSSSSVSAYFTTGGSIALSGTLDRVRITTVNGTDTFDAGSINILWE